MELPKRKTIRLKNFDYSGSYYYFITICTHEKKCIFGNINQLNQYGKITEKCIKKIHEVFPSVYIDEYIVMPNHVHMILFTENALQKGNLPNIPTIVGQFKMAVTKEIRKVNPNCIVWQRSFYDHVIRNEKSYCEIWKYVKYNDQKWAEDCYFIDQDNI